MKEAFYVRIETTEHHIFGLDCCAADVLIDWMNE